MQTVTDYIFQQLEEEGLIFLNTKTNEMTISISVSDYLDMKRLAKELGKQQIMEFAYSAVRKILDEDRTNPFNLEEYYNETYGSKGSDETKTN